MTTWDLFFSALNYQVYIEQLHYIFICCRDHKGQSVTKEIDDLETMFLGGANGPASPLLPAREERLHGFPGRWRKRELERRLELVK